MDYGIFSVRTDVNACDYTQGCTVTARESALKVDSRTKILCRTEESNLRHRLAGPTLCQLSYIPIPPGLFNSNVHMCHKQRIRLALVLYWIVFHFDLIFALD